MPTVNKFRLKMIHICTYVLIPNVLGQVDNMLKILQATTTSIILLIEHTLSHLRCVQYSKVYIPTNKVIF